MALGTQVIFGSFFLSILQFKKTISSPSAAIVAEQTKVQVLC
jgi:hypothetical protein